MWNLSRNGRICSGISYQPFLHSTTTGEGSLNCSSGSTVDSTSRCWLRQLVEKERWFGRLRQQRGHGARVQLLNPFGSREQTGSASISAIAVRFGESSHIRCGSPAMATYSYMRSDATIGNCGRIEWIGSSRSASLLSLSHLCAWSSFVRQAPFLRRRQLAGRREGVEPPSFGPIAWSVPCAVRRSPARGRVRGSTPTRTQAAFLVQVELGIRYRRGMSEQGRFLQGFERSGLCLTMRL